MAKKKKQPELSIVKGPFNPDPEDDVQVINAYDAKKKGPFIPQMYTVKRKQLEELHRRGWIYAPDFYRRKSMEREKLNREYDTMFAHMNKGK